jgi:hypothetical protein
MSVKESRVVIKTVRYGEKTVTIDGKNIELFEDEGIMVPILTLSSLTTQELSEFYGIAVEITLESDEIKKYPTIGNFSELRICFYSHLAGPGVKASVIVFDPEDIEALGLHIQYQLQLEDELSNYNNVEIWDSVKDKIGLDVFDKISSLRLKPFESTSIGYVGFWVDLIGTSYEQLLIQLFQFLEIIDEKVRKKIQI